MNAASNQKDISNAYFNKINQEYTYFMIGSASAFVFGLVLIYYGKRRDKKAILSFLNNNALEELTKMKNQGIITEEEFETKKKAVLEKI